MTESSITGMAATSSSLPLADSPSLSLCALIRSDYRRFVALGANRPLKTIFFCQGLWATFVYRVSHHLYYRTPFSPLRKLMRLFCQIARKAIEILTGISLPPECQIGEGLYIGHFGTIIVSSLAVIGKNCNLSQGVTLGVSGRGDRRGAPIIGNRVYIAANAVVAGKITIGDDVVIGACTVVTTSVPPRTVVAGNPAQIRSCRGSFTHILYDGMEKDPERQASLALSEIQAPTADSSSGDTPTETSGDI
jgi:serine O-acetyltransferase